MAHVAKLAALTDELLLMILSTSTQSDAPRYNSKRDYALRAFRHNNYARTSQFDIESRLDGLEEKFRIYNQDFLANALHERREILKRLEAKWTPEILHLILELSGRPLSNVKAEHLELLKEPEPGTGPPLRWSDLTREDPLLQEKSVWKNVDFRAESSDEEDGLHDSRSEAGGTETTLQSSIDEDYCARPEHHIVETANEEALNRLCSAQFWRKVPNVHELRLETFKKSMTELEAVREVLFMLGGYPTSLFKTDPKQPTSIRPSTGYTLKHTFHDDFSRLLESLATQGSSIMALRFWAKGPQNISLLQVLQSVIQEHVAELDALLSKMEMKYVTPTEQVAVSLLAVREEVAHLMRPLTCLADIILKLHEDLHSHAFIYLELIYDQTCTSQMAGDDAMYLFMGEVFFRCFEVYLRPIRLWIEEGELTKADTTFFISEIAGDIELSSIWETRFRIRKTRDGVLYAPRFLAPAASKIFTTGKSVFVLKYLHQFDLLQSARGEIEPTVDFETVCNPKNLYLAPFSELFDVAFDGWVQSKHRYASSILRKTLFDSCGLHTVLDAYSHIYFLSDGSIGACFINSVFDKMDSLKSSWNDQFTLTELAQSTFGLIPSVSSDRLRTSVLTLAQKYQDIVKCRKTVKSLEIIEIRYQILWPIQIIVTPVIISSYKRIFTFLVQIRRSFHVLSRNPLKSDSLHQVSSSDERALYYSLRMRLVWFTQVIYYYLTCLVLEPCSEKMQADLKAAEDVDKMIDVYSTFAKTCVDQALLGSKLEPIHKTVLKILDLGIMLEDVRTVHAVANKNIMQNQQGMMDLSIASLGLHTPNRCGRPWDFSRSVRESTASSSDEDNQELDVNNGLMSPLTPDDSRQEPSYLEKLYGMRADCDRLVRFVASGLKGVARAGEGVNARNWDILGEMLDAGLENGRPGYF